jgi:circadian clock protein KaiC
MANAKASKQSSVKASIPSPKVPAANKAAAEAKAGVQKAGDGHFLTGVKGLDELLVEGIPLGSSVLVEGGPGSGKTILCLNIAANFCARGKKVLYMSFEEPEERLIEHMCKFHWDARSFVDKGLLRVKRFNALDVARSVEALLSEAKKELFVEVHPIFFPRDFEPDLVLVDSLTSISSAFSGEESRFRIYMEQLFRYLEKEQISSLLIREVVNPAHTGLSTGEQGEAVSFLSDGIIIIYNVLYPTGQRGAAIEILKMRGTPILKKIVKMQVSETGVAIYPDQIVPTGCTLT